MATALYKVASEILKIWKTPTGNITQQQFQFGDLVQVDPNTRLEVGDSVWFRHSLGWSPERSLDNTAIYLKLVATPDKNEIEQNTDNQFTVGQNTTMFQVVNGVNIRSFPSLSDSAKTKFRLQSGMLVQADAHSKIIVSDYIWWRHTLGWSAERHTNDGKNEVYLKPIVQKAIESPPQIDPKTNQKSDEKTQQPENKNTTTDKPSTENKALVPKTTNTLVEMQVASTDGVNLRAEARQNSERTNGLPYGTIIEVDLSTAIENKDDGYIWLKFGHSWVAWKQINDRGTPFLIEIQPTEDSSPPDKKTTTDRNIDDLKDTLQSTDNRPTIPETSPQIVKMKVVSSNGLNIRAEADANSKDKGDLAHKDVIEVDLSTAIENKNDGYTWLKYGEAWVAWKKTHGSLAPFLRETTDAITAISISDLTPEKLPEYQSLIKKLPVALNDTQWFQYFGNNIYAEIYGKNHSYDVYSQGLHGGLDFGNSSSGSIQIRAGVHGTVFQIDEPKNNKGNWKVWVKSGDYVIIYQHIYQIKVTKEELPIRVQPDTVLAEIRPSSDDGSDHLHFEVRYLNSKYIVNPLWLMPKTDVDAIVKKFNPLRKYNKEFDNQSQSELYYFYRNTSWSKWATPWDQPIIENGNQTQLGPRG